MGRLPAFRADQACAADRQREVRAIHHARRPVADAWARPADSRLAVFGRSADGRGDESVDAVDSRCLRASAAESERRADSRRAAVEVRLQEREVAREDPLCRNAAADELEHRSAERVRLLFEREPERRSPALEPGDRAAYRRGRVFHAEAQDADVQRLRGSRRVDVSGYGFAEILLSQAAPIMTDMRTTLINQGSGNV